MIELFREIASNSNSLVYLLILLLIISIFINLALLNSRLAKKFRGKKLQSELPGHIQKYLDSQASRTQNSDKIHDIPKLDEQVKKIRSAYLQIESKSIDRGIDSEGYWNILNSKLSKLFEIILSLPTKRILAEIKAKIDIIKTSLKESPDSESKAKILTCLDSLFKSCESNNDPASLAQYSKKLNRILLRFTDREYAKLDTLSKINKDYNDNCTTNLMNLRKHADTSDLNDARLQGEEHNEINNKIEKYEENGKRLKDRIDNYGENIQSIQGNISSVSDEAFLVSSEEKAKTANKELAELTEKIQQANEQEIARLRSLVKEQKSTINELMDDIRHIDVEGDPPNEASPDIEKLKSSLREAETCIEMLETQLNTIKTGSDDYQVRIENSKHEDFPPVSARDAEEFENTIANLTREVEHSKDEIELLKQVANFASESFNAATFEDISLLLYETLNTINADASLIIYGPTRTFEISGSGKISKRIATIVNNMNNNENNVGTNKSTLFFKYKNLGGAVKPKNELAFSSLQTSLIFQILDITNKMFDRTRVMLTQKNQHKTIDDCANTIKKVAAEIDSTLEKITHNSSSTISDSFGQIQDIAKSSGLSASHIARLNALEKDALEELGGDQHLKLKLKKLFLSVLAQLEDIDQY